MAKILIGNIKGPAGPSGPQGIQGPAGATGPQGPLPPLTNNLLADQAGIAALDAFQGAEIKRLIDTEQQKVIIGYIEGDRLSDNLKQLGIELTHNLAEVIQRLPRNGFTIIYSNTNQGNFALSLPVPGGMCLHIHKNYGGDRGDIIATDYRTGELYSAGIYESSVKEFVRYTPSTVSTELTGGDLSLLQEGVYQMHHIAASKFTNLPTEMQNYSTLYALMTVRQTYMRTRYFCEIVDLSNCTTYKCTKTDKAAALNWTRC